MDVDRCTEEFHCGAVPRRCKLSPDHAGACVIDPPLGMGSGPLLVTRADPGRGILTIEAMPARAPELCAEPLRMDGLTYLCELRFNHEGQHHATCAGGWVNWGLDVGLKCELGAEGGARCDLPPGHVGPHVLARQPIARAARGGLAE
jgi:hypothetical protein